MGQACIRPFRGLRSPKATGEREQLIAAENSAASSQITVPYEAEEACGYVNEEDTLAFGPMAPGLNSEQHGAEESQPRAIPAIQIPIPENGHGPGLDVAAAAASLVSSARSMPVQYPLPEIRGVRTSNSSLDNLTRIEDIQPTAKGVSMTSVTDSVKSDELVIRQEGKPSVNIRVDEFIGHGEYGSVYKGSNLNTSEVIAVKRIPLQGFQEGEIAQLANQVDLLTSLSHPRIIKYKGVTRHHDALNIILEYAGNGSLKRIVDASEEDREGHLARYVIEMLDGLEYLHNHDTIHGNLKASNVLTAADGTARLSDFGLSIPRAQGETRNRVKSLFWSAPEVVQSGSVSNASDIWSLGCTLIEFLTGKPPHYPDVVNTTSATPRIVQADIPQIPGDISPLLTDFIQQCLREDPSQRPSAQELSEHRWLLEDEEGSIIEPVLSASSVSDSEAETHSIVSEASEVSEPSADSSEESTSAWSH